MTAEIKIFAFLLICIIGAAFAASPEDAAASMITAENSINEMRDAGFGTALVKDIFLDAKNLFGNFNISSALDSTQAMSLEERKINITELLKAAKNLAVDYDSVVRKTGQIEETKNKAFFISDQITALDSRLSDMIKNGLNVTAVDSAILQIKEDFKLERYDEVQKQIEAANAKIDELESQATRLDTLLSAKGKSFVKYLEQNAYSITAGIIIAVIIFLIAKWRLSKYIMKRKLNNYLLEQKIILDLMKKAQFDRFSKGSITKHEYEIKMEKFKELLTTTEKNIAYYKSRLSGRKIESKVKPDYAIGNYVLGRSSETKKPSKSFILAQNEIKAGKTRKKRIDRH